MTDDLVKRVVDRQKSLAANWKGFPTGRDAEDVLAAFEALEAENARLVAQRDKDILAEKMLMVNWCAKRQAVSRKAWERAARKALAGDMSELRNRIAMIDAGPMDIVLSDTPAQEGEP